jgi:hypothetical protein
LRGAAAQRRFTEALKSSEIHITSPSCTDLHFRVAEWPVSLQDGDASQAPVRTFLSESDMLAYLAMMAPRLVELVRVMKPTASIYLPCDPTASHSRLSS